MDTKQARSSLFSSRLINQLADALNIEFLKKKNLSKIFRFPNPLVGSMDHGQASGYGRAHLEALLQNFYLIDPGISSFNLFLQVTPGNLRAHDHYCCSAALKHHLNGP